MLKEKLKKILACILVIMMILLNNGISYGASKGQEFFAEALEKAHDSFEKVITVCLEENPSPQEIIDTVTSCLREFDSNGVGLNSGLTEGEILDSIIDYLWGNLSHDTSEDTAYYAWIGQLGIDPDQIDPDIFNRADDIIKKATLSETTEEDIQNILDGVSVNDDPNVGDLSQEEQNRFFEEFRENYGTAFNTLVQDCNNATTADDRIAAVQKFLDETGLTVEYLEDVLTGGLSTDNYVSIDSSYDKVIDAIRDYKNSVTIGTAEEPIDPFAQLLDGIAGILLYPLKIMPAIIGKLLRWIMDGATGTGAPITIYNILFNKIALTDINFFINEPSTANNASVINAIRNNVAIWYYSIRNLAAVVLAIILVYIGIRMAISTIAEDKAKYKTMFVDWATSLCLLFVLQFIIVATININDAFINVLQRASSDTINLDDIDGELWDGVWHIGFIESLGNSIAYMMLVGMSFVYFFAYIKRMITIAFLIIISPLITVTYSIDKMGDGKSQALNTWLKEFVYNILIQPFQCIIYLSLASSVLKLLVGHGSGSLSLINVFIAVYVLMFMYQAEEIVKKIFGFQSESMGKTIAAAAVTSALISKGTNLFKGGSKNKNASKGPSSYQRRPQLNNNGNDSGETGGGSGGSTPGGAGGSSGSGTGGDTPGGTGGSSGSGAAGGTAGSTASSGASSGAAAGGAAGVVGGLALGLLKANVAGGLKIAGTALGLSTGKLETGVAGYSLGSSASTAINKNIEKKRQNRYDEERKAQVARDIDDYQKNHGYTNTQVQQNIEDWLDGISLPDQNDDDGLKLYQHLMQEMQALEDRGLSADDSRAALEQTIVDTFTGKQRRVPPKAFQKTRDRVNRFTGSIKEFVNNRRKNS